MTKTSRLRTLLWLALVFIAGAPAAWAGTIDVAWNAVTDADLAGYRVYWGTSAGVYTQNRDVGNTTTTQLSGLDPCTRYYVAVKSYDTGGLESANYSNEVSGLPRPIVNSVTPSSAEQGTSLTLTIAGESYDNNPTVEFSGTGITLLATRRDSCNQLSVDIRIDAAAATGARDVFVTNPDRSYGVRTGGFTVAANASPTVSSTSPTAGATSVAINVRPTVTFSEPMDPASITSTTVRLLNPSGAAVAQAAGSPALSADRRIATITPSANLQYSTTYRIAVTGGASGVKDQTGRAMAADWQQNPGFTTAAAPDTTPPQVNGATPADGATGVVVGVRPQVVFSEAMDPASITSSTVQLLDSSGVPVTQAAGSPALSADRTTATITPAASLREMSNYKIRVVGGASGVKDAAGNNLASTWSQPTGFTTENLPPGVVTGLNRTDVR